MKQPKSQSGFLSELILRLITAILGIPLLALIVWAGDPWFTLSTAMVAVFGLAEFYTLVARRWPKPNLLLGLFWTGIFVIHPFLGNVYTLPLVGSASLVISLPLLFLKLPSRIPVQSWVWTMIGTLAIGWTLSHLIFLRHELYGREWIIFTISTIFATDAGAYFVGKAIGRHKLTPKISPNKTWEGAIGGVATAIAIAILNYYIFNLPIQIGHLIGLSIIVPILSMTGDLAESSLKRWVHTKEAGSWFPGHGGILDRLDSVVLTAVVVYYYVRWLTG